jgi:hypothetical protein
VPIADGQVLDKENYWSSHDVDAKPSPQRFAATGASKTRCTGASTLHFARTSHASEPTMGPKTSLCSASVALNLAKSERSQSGRPGQAEARLLERGLPSHAPRRRDGPNCPESSRLRCTRPAPQPLSLRPAARLTVGCSQSGMNNVTQGGGRGSLYCFAVITGE